VRALLDAGADVHGFGDVHQDVIGWAAIYEPPSDVPADKEQVLTLLLNRGARPHIFFAICLGHLGLIQKLVGQNP
jgi:hypothetical protein